MADAGSESDCFDEENEVESAITKRKFNNKEKLSIIKELERFPSLWKSSETFSRERKLRAIEELSCKFTTNEESLKKLIYSLRSSVIREIKREKDDK